MSGGQQNEWAREVFRKHERRAEALEIASVESANLALKSLLLLNGGACIALLGFLASIFSANVQQQESARELAPFLAALSKFASGAGLAVFASSLAYLTNSAYARSLMTYDKKWEWPYVEANEKSKRDWRIGTYLNNVAIVVSIASLGMFVWGCIAIGFAY